MFKKAAALRKINPISPSCTMARLCKSSYLIWRALRRQIFNLKTNPSPTREVLMVASTDGTETLEDVSSWRIHNEKPFK